MPADTSKSNLIVYFLSGRSRWILQALECRVLGQIVMSKGRDEDAPTVGIL